MGTLTNLRMWLAYKLYPPSFIRAELYESMYHSETRCRLAVEEDLTKEVRANTKLTKENEQRKVESLFLTSHLKAVSYEVSRIRCILGNMKGVCKSTSQIYFAVDDLKQKIIFMCDNALDRKLSSTRDAADVSPARHDDPLYGNH